MVCVNVQVLGLFIVQITAAGCLYFLDLTNIANDRGLAAAGILLMLLNIAYVAAMLILIGINGASKTKQYTRTALAEGVVCEAAAVPLGQSECCKWLRGEAMRG